MQYFMLFQVPKETDYHEFKSALKRYCKLEWFKLTDDMKRSEYRFGQFEAVVTDREGLYALFDAHGIQAKEKPSDRSAPSSHPSKNPKRDPGKERRNERSPKEEADMKIANPSFHFYRSREYGKGIESYRFDASTVRYFEIPESEGFELTTLYPGLLVGAGYMHPKLKENKDDFQLGFFFDHTTGLPLISGSSIKGLVRSVFPSEERGANGTRKERYYDEKIAFLKAAYGVAYTPQLVEEIFESRKVVFYDAYIVRTANDGKIFGSDFITSHYSDDPRGIFKEPNPVKFLKVLPGVTFRFQFGAPQKYIALFEKILLDLGVGAKTNVGYGKFIKAG
jgi:CRISPR-associated protein Cmr6